MGGIILTVSITHLSSLLKYGNTVSASKLLTLSSKLRVSGITPLTLAPAPEDIPCPPMRAAVLNHSSLFVSAGIGPRNMWKEQGEFAGRFLKGTKR